MPGAVVGGLLCKCKLGALQGDAESLIALWVARALPTLSSSTSLCPPPPCQPTLAPQRLISHVENVIGGAGAVRSSRHRLPQHETQRRLGPEQGAQHVGPNHLNHLLRRDVDEQPLGGDLSCRTPVDGAAGGGMAATAAGSLSRWGGDAGSETCAPCHRPPTTMQRSQPPAPPALLIHKSTPPSLHKLCKVLGPRET